MDKNNENLEFDLEDILNEFHDYSADEPAQEQTRAIPTISGETEREPVAGAQKEEEERVPEQMPVLSAQTLRFEPLTQPEKTEPAEQEAESEPASEKPEDTTAFQPEQEQPQEEKETPEQTGETRDIPAPIVFTPRSRLRELKKKLVSGPEKRYYELEGQGLGSLQIAILINIGLTILCGWVTTLFALDMMAENRLRLVIFTQVLAMMISGLTACNLMLDSLGELLRGKFTLNTLLTLTFAACFLDGVFCLMELRIPCCGAFCLEVTMALWARYHRHTTEMAQMDTMRKAVRLHGIVKVSDYYKGQKALLRTEAQVEDFMEHYNKVAGPELAQNVYAALSLLACMAIAVFAGIMHGVSMGVQILAASMLVAVPASFFVSVTRPMALLENRLHMVGSVLCGWRGIKGLSGKAVFPLADTDLFPQGSTKLNGVKFYSDRDPDQVVAYATALITQAGGGLVPVFQQMLSSREGRVYQVEHFQNYGDGGIGGEVNGEPVLLGGLNFLQDMGVEIPEGTMVNQAVYASIDGQLCAVFAMSYAKMRSASAGLVTLCGYRKLTPVMLCGDFTLTESFVRGKFGIKSRRMVFPSRDERAQLSAVQPDPEAKVLGISTREELISYAYLATGARSVRTSMKLAVGIHLAGGIVGLLIMLVLAILGNTQLLTPTNVLLYQLVWAVPGLLVTEWARIV